MEKNSVLKTTVKNQNELRGEQRVLLNEDLYISTDGSREKLIHILAEEVTTKQHSTSLERHQVILFPRTPLSVVRRYLQSLNIPDAPDNGSILMERQLKLILARHKGTRVHIEELLEKDRQERKILISLRRRPNVRSMGFPLVHATAGA